MRRGVLICVLAVFLLPATAHAAFPGQNGKIAFTQAGEIWTMNPDGTAQVNLTNNPASDVDPAWSADGNRIAFTTDRDGTREIWTMLANGTGLAKVIGTNDLSTGQPTWAPDGQKLAYVGCCAEEGGNALFTVNTDGTVAPPSWNRSASSSSRRIGHPTAAGSHT